MVFPILQETKLSGSPSIFGVHSSFIFLITSFKIFILCCFISSPSVDSSCLLCRRCKLYSLNKEKTLAQQSSHHYFSCTSCFYAHASAPTGRLSFTVLDLLQPEFFPPNSSSFVASHTSISSFFLRLPSKSCLAFLSSVHSTILSLSSFFFCTLYSFAL